MSDYTINEHLAVKVMKLCHSDCGSWYGKWHGEYSFERCFDVEDWNPTKHIEQALMCLNHFKDWQIRKNHPTAKGMYLVTIDFDSCSDESLSKAICMACAKATG